MNILIIPYNYPTKENQNRAIFVQDQVHMLRNQGDNVIVIGGIPKTISDIISSRSLHFGKHFEERWLITFPALRGFNRFNNWLRTLCGKYLIKKYFKQNSGNLPDILHVHNSSSGELALWVKKKYNIPFVVTEHSSIMWSGYNKLSGLIFKESKANIAVSKKFAQQLSQQYNENFYYIPNVVDTSYFKPMQITSKTDNNSFSIDSAVFVSVGNLTENKNHKLAIKALKRLLGKYNNLKLFIAGDGCERYNVQNLINTLELCDHVFLLGRLSRPEIRELLWRSDYFLLPSKSETFGVALIEAMAAGLPTLSLKNGGSESIISDNVGFIADNDNDFIECMEQLLLTQYDKEHIIEHARLNFSQGAVYQLLKQVYAL
ncbi:MAG: hypothetical protein CVV11_07055 [Gammaproteobacteria bacterium HGW-Gammaproteobacteria-15]|nr:MAG: hypothetical protein CVV11_07055 [Gammaproteobacteria bacterium HGW-Gammaproteobacteria-15]